MRHLSLTTLAIAICGLANAQTMGPSTKYTPYYIPKLTGVKLTSILTVGEGPNGYRMVGIPDGMGAHRNAQGGLELLMNHEIKADEGIVRAHGFTGAFVSKWTIDPKTLEVTAGSDLIQKILPGNHGTGPFGRFCSADLAPSNTFYNSKSGLGTRVNFFLTGEEVDVIGRAVGTIVTGPLAGTAAILPALGKMSYENVVAHPSTGDQTVVACMDDSNGGQVYFYKGMKTNTGNDFAKAGLMKGTLFGLSVKDFPKETPATGREATTFALVDMGDNTNASGKLLEARSTEKGVTQFARPEDFHWHPTKRNIAYWTTTGMTGLGSKLWRITFKDVNKIELGGTIEAVLTTDDGIRSLDNLTIDRKGNVLVQEDPGKTDHLAKIWHYDATSDKVTMVAEADPTRFLPNAPNFLTADEESSGIIDVSEFLGQGWFMFGVQAHYPVEPELVQGGQLLALYVPL
jgi:hypothetical protein